MQYKTVLASLLSCTAMAVQAEQIEKPASKDISISIYNNDLALVRDVRETNFKEGLNNVAFEGVASALKPESVMISGDDIRVLEQNYDYALLTEYNILEKSVGQNVKTLRINPATGQNMFDHAKILSYQNGSPVLQFEYGIETSFDGHLVFEELPQSLHQKPTLAAKISSLKEGLKDITLVYLTKGMSWKTDYVAGIKNEDTLDLTGWVTIQNNSGVAYENASVQLIAGKVNEVSAPRLARGLMMTKAAVAENYALEADGMALNSVEPESFSAYQLYSLPNRTDIKDNQTKQIALIEQNDVAYRKEGRLNSRLYFNGDYVTHFEKVHPEIYYVLKNDEESNLGVPLPQGVIRFYENDSKGNVQFIGENSIGETAKGEELELNIGQMFDVFVDGKVSKVRKVSENVIKDNVGKCPRYRLTRAYDSEVTFHNGGKTPALIVFYQYIPSKTKIVDESIKGKISDKSADKYEWRVDLNPEQERTLQFTAEVTFEETRCN